MSKKNKNSGGLVYSTANDWLPEVDEEIIETLPAHEQKLKAHLETKHRAGKSVVLIRGFIGSDIEAEKLCKLIKQGCGCGGSYKDGEILIQSPSVEKVREIGKKLGYKIS